MGLWEIFDQVYLINLPERKDRLRDSKSELESMGFDYKNSNSFTLFSAIKPAEKAGFPSRGAQGCFRSHLGVLKDAIDKKYDCILVLEDDLEFLASSNKVLDDYAMSIKKEEWDVLYVGHFRKAPDTINKLYEIEPVQGLRCSQAIAYRLSALTQLVPFLELMLTRPVGHPDGGPMDVDGAFSTFRKNNPHIRTLLANPSLIGQRSSSSDIAEKEFEKYYFIRFVLDQIRYLKNSLIKSLRKSP